MARSALSSTDSGCHMPEQDQYLRNDSLTTPYYHTSPSTEARGIATSGKLAPTTTAAIRLTEEDYLTLCQQDDRGVATAEGPATEPASAQRDSEEGVVLVGSAPEVGNSAADGRSQEEASEGTNHHESLALLETRRLTISQVGRLKARETKV